MPAQSYLSIVSDRGPVEKGGVFACGICVGEDAEEKGLGGRSPARPSGVSSRVSRIARACS